MIFDHPPNLKMLTSKHQYLKFKCISVLNIFGLRFAFYLVRWIQKYEIYIFNISCCGRHLCSQLLASILLALYLSS